MFKYKWFTIFLIRINNFKNRNSCRKRKLGRTKNWQKHPHPKWSVAKEKTLNGVKYAECMTFYFIWNGFSRDSGDTENSSLSQKVLDTKKYPLEVAQEFHVQSFKAPVNVGMVNLHNKSAVG